MPALLTHYLCGNAMLKLAEDDHVKNSIQSHRNIFNLGTQGPDLFFYYGAWPWTKSNGMTEFGDRMHEENTGEFILEALKYLSGCDEASKSILTAYMCGYICHYELDCSTHPYIFYKTGFLRAGEAYTPKYICYHRMFETALDVLMLKRELNKKPCEFKVSGQLRISAGAADAIGRMYSSVSEKVYKADIGSELVCRAISDIAAINSVLWDRTGLKKRLLSALESLLGKPPLFSSMILPLEIKDGLDYLNISRSVWYTPWDNKTPLTSSFTECFDTAASDACKAAAAVIACIDGGMDPAGLLPLIGNRSFSTGKDCNMDLEFKYSDCIYE